MKPGLVVGVAVITFITATICLALTRRILANRQLMDVPNDRSSHSEPTLRGGGLGIVAGLLVGLGSGALMLTGSAAELANIAVIGLTVGALAVVGLTEDIRGLGVGVRLLVQTLTFAIATAGFVCLAGLPIALGLVAGLAGVFYVNTANFMDGVNGISSMHGAVVGVYFVIVGYASNDHVLALAGVATGVAFLAFLPWNAPRARMFMGDVGSYALGGAAWALAVSALSRAVPLFAVAAPLLVYSADVVLTLVRRAIRREHLTHAHHEHAYQRVQEITHSHGAATAVVTTGTIMCAGIGLWSLLIPSVTPWAIALSVGVLALVQVAPSILAHRWARTQ